MGTSKRRAMRELADVIAQSNRSIEGVTLGQACAANLIVLEIACHRCPRRGRYRLTGLIDRYRPAMALSELKNLLSADCPHHLRTDYFNQCGTYFPGWERQAKRGER